MFRLEKSFRFEASHLLPLHDGKCARLHGHSWIGRLLVEGQALVADGPKKNMLVDYGDLSALLADLVETHLDHHHLNETLDTDTPTSEYVARWVYWQLKPVCGMLAAVVIEETCTSRCEYRPGPDERPWHP